MGQTRDGKAVAPLPSATTVTEPGMDRAPSDDQREERCVNPLLYAVAVSVQPPALPRMARPRIARCDFKEIPAKQSVWREFHFEALDFDN